MNAWDHLPNARHIDWVLASLTTHTEIWAATRGAYEMALGATESSALDVTLRAAWDAAWDAAKGATRAAAYDAARATRAAAYDAARNVTLALIAYDDCAHLLDMPSEQLKAWAVLSENPAAILLLPAVIAREQIRELEKA
jgi:hypothetical protein